MTSIHIGSNSEYIKIGLPSSYSVEGWAQADVEIAVRGFVGNIRPWVETVDFEIFTAQLKAMYQSLAGESVFSPLEKQFTMKLTSRTGGHILVTGEAWSEACYGSKLEYEFEIDQSFLVGPLQILETLMAVTTKKTI